MSGEASQSLESRGLDPPSKEQIPSLVVEPTADRWKRTAKKQTPPPRFGIRHMLIWTVCWGAYIAIARRYLPDDPGFFNLLSAGLFGVGYSAALLGLAICLTRRTRSEPWPIEPGEWLLVVIGVTFVLNELQSRMFPHTFQTPPLVLAAVQSVLFVIPLLGRTMSRLWKSLFLLFLAFRIGPIAVVMLNHLLHLGDDSWLVAASRFLRSSEWLVDGLLPALFAAIDYRHFRQYTWLHWLGISTGVWLTVCLIVVWIINSLA